MGTESQQNKQLPNSQEAEEAILGSILINNKIMHDIAELITTDDFHFPQCRKIYKHIMEIWGEGGAIDVLTLQESLKRTKELDSVGGPVYIDHLYDQVPASENARHYAWILRENTLRRQIITLGQELVDYGYNSHDSENVLRDTVGQKFTQLAHNQLGKGFQSLSHLVDKLIPEIQERRDKKGYSGLRTGYENLNNILGGFQKSDLLILAARPSAGKTALALNIAENVAREGGHVIFFTLEMSGEQLALRLLSSLSGINSQRIRKGEISDKEMSKKILPTFDDMDDMQIFIVDNPGITPFQIRAQARRIAHDPEGGVELIIVDYLQLISMQSQQRYDGRVQEVSEISRSLKSLARELQVPVLAISQLSRESEKQNRAPKLSDLRESGALEQDADVVMFIHRKQTEKEELSIDGMVDAQLIIAKHRNGPTGRLKMKFEMARTRFYAAPDVKDAGFEDEDSSANDDM